MDMGIRGRKAIVCAASKGLGKGCAMALAGEGVDLVINARTKSELEATAEEIRKKHGVKVTPVAVDVTTEAGRKQVLAACPEPDIVVNNAGVGIRRPWLDTSEADWQLALQTNLLGADRVSRAACRWESPEQVASAITGREIFLSRFRQPIGTPMLAIHHWLRCGFSPTARWTICSKRQRKRPKKPFLIQSLQMQLGE
mgnify:CR=1 FL=1